MRIDRCVCLNVTFRHLKEVSGQTGCASVKELQAHEEFGTKCGLCKPYVREMLRSGKTEFHAIIRT
jgi:bacterioferritin-associated ferredoxin